MAWQESSNHLVEYLMSMLLNRFLKKVLVLANIGLISINCSAIQPSKKLIEYGWDRPYPDFVRENILEMEKKPFDGIMFRLRKYDHMFDIRQWDLNEINQQREDLVNINWEKFTDNFLCLYAANRWGMDWFNDNHWKIIEAHVKLIAQIAKAGNLVGLCLDPEPYGNNPWSYDDYIQYSFEEVSEKVRERGEQFITAIQADMPHVKLLTLYNFSLYHSVADVKTVRARERKLKTYPWPLYPAFLDGMLQAAGPSVTIIDGFEQSYSFYESNQFFEGRDVIKSKSMDIVSPENRQKYKEQVSAGMAVFVDHLLAMRPKPKLYASYYLDEETRLLWLQKNVYNALLASDEYVWLYSQRMNWWNNEIPKGAEDALRAVLNKVANQQPMEFSIQSAIERAKLQQKLEKILP